MKKLFSFAVLVLALGAVPMLGHAEKTCTADAGASAACVEIIVDQENETGSIELDGDKGNEDPLDGYVHLQGDSSGAVECHASDEGNFKEDSEDETPPATCQETVVISRAGRSTLPAG